MGRTCIVLSCKRQGPTIHSFPSAIFKPKQRSTWIKKAVSSAQMHLKLQYYGVCSNHFDVKDYEMWSKSKGLNATKTGRLSQYAIPSLHLAVEKGLVDKMPANLVEATKSSLDAPIYYGPKSAEAYLIEAEAKILTLEVKIENQSILLKNAETLIKVKNAKIHAQGKKSINDEKRILDLQNQIKLSEDLLARFFTKGQIRILKGKYNKFIHWEDEDISKALTLYSVSYKAYSFLRDNCQYPLPSISTLKLWLRKVDVTPGKLIPSGEVQNID